MSLRRRMILGKKEKNVLYKLKSGISTDGSIVTVSGENRVYAMSNSTTGKHMVWLNPSCDGYSTSVNSFDAGAAIWPTETLFALSVGDVVRFVITNNDTAITSRWQPLYVGLATEKTEKIISENFQTLTEITTEVIVEENIEVTALFVHINKYDLKAEFNLEVYVNDVKYF